MMFTNLISVLKVKIMTNGLNSGSVNTLKGYTVSQPYRSIIFTKGVINFSGYIEKSKVQFPGGFFRNI